MAVTRRMCQPNVLLIGAVTPPCGAAKAASASSGGRAVVLTQPRSSAPASLIPATSLATAAKSLPDTSCAWAFCAVASSGSSICWSWRCSGVWNSSCRFAYSSLSSASLGRQEAVLVGVVELVDLRLGRRGDRTGGARRQGGEVGDAALGAGAVERIDQRLGRRHAVGERIR